MPRPGNSARRSGDGAATAEPTSEPRSGQKFLFWLALLSIPLGFFLAIEVGVRALWDDDAPEDAYLTFVGRPSFFEKVEIDGRPHYRVTHPEAYRARNTSFPVEKRTGTLRIFCLGGSASAGWPHPPGEIYSVYLEEALARALPERSFEVIDVSAHAYPAYRVRFIFERVVDFDPDFIVIYSGNNEFLEKRTYLRRWEGLEAIAAAANHLATFRRLRSWVIRHRYPENTLSGAGREDVSLGIWTKLARISTELRSDPGQFEQVKAHYAESIEAMVREGERRGIRLVLATVPVNLRDWVPNVSSTPLSGEERARWQHLYDAGRGAILEGDLERAIGSLRKAIDLAPGHAETHFRLGRALEQKGDFEAAVRAYTRAVDLDRNPFRAISDFNATLRAVAREHANVRLADLEAAFLAASAPRAPGFDLLLDYVHPTKPGNLIVARTVLEGLLRSGISGTPAEGEPLGNGPAHLDGDASSYDEDLDLELQSTLFFLFGMMHQYEAMVAKAEHLSARGVKDLPVLDEVLDVFRDHLYMERRRLLGRPVTAEERQRIQAEVARYYRRNYSARLPEEAF